MATLAIQGARFEVAQVSTVAGFPSVNSAVRISPTFPTELFPGFNTADNVTTWPNPIAAQPVFPLPNPPPAGGGQFGFPI